MSYAPIKSLCPINGNLLIIRYILFPHTTLKTESLAVYTCHRGTINNVIPIQISLLGCHTIQSYWCKAMLLRKLLLTSSGYREHTNETAYTGCHRRKGPNFGRVFLMLNYTDITQNTYIQSWTVTEIMAREKCGHLAFPRNVRLHL